MFLSWVLLIIPIVLIVEAIIYAAVKRFERLLMTVATFFPLGIVQPLNQFVTWMETVVIASVINIFIIVPSSLILIAVGGILYWTRRSRSA